MSPARVLIGTDVKCTAPPFNSNERIGVGSTAKHAQRLEKEKR